MLRKLFSRKEGLPVQDEILENIPCTDFKEALEAGILSPKPFKVNGIEFYGFAQHLQMVTAHRYLQYVEYMQMWKEFGMNSDTARDYIDEALEHIETAFDNASEPRAVKKALDEARVTLRIQQSHLDNFNVIGAMLEMCSITYIMPCESPYNIDYEKVDFKIDLWQRSLAVEGQDFINFFWKLSSLNELDWMNRLIESMSSMAKGEERTEREKEEDQIQRDLLSLDIFRQKRILEEQRRGNDSWNRVRYSRTMSNLIKLKWNELAFSTISSTGS